jgi:hypothetical protein
MKKEKRRPQGHKRKKRIPIPKWNPKIRFVDPDDSILCSDVYPPDKNPKPRKYGMY